MSVTEHIDYWVWFSGLYGRNRKDKTDSKVFIRVPADQPLTDEEAKVRAQMTLRDDVRLKRGRYTIQARRVSVERREDGTVFTTGYPLEYQTIATGSVG